MMIIDKVIPSAVLLARFNPREETIEMQLSNQQARVRYGVRSNDTFGEFITKTTLDEKEIDGYTAAGGG